jgi:predicted phosphodiesterase
VTFKLHVLSDLHTEFKPFTLPAVDSDVLVLAGDIGVGIEGVKAARAWSEAQPVVYVLGNHEYYKQRWPEHVQRMREAASGSRVYVLDDEVVVIQGIRFLGSTLWTDFRLHGDSAEAQSRLVARRNMHDYDTICHTEDRWLDPLDTQAAHEQSVRWLREQLVQPFNGPTVVVTHHLPSQRSIDPRFQRGGNDVLNPAFASNLDHLIRPPAKLWVHGHTHVAKDYELNGTRVVCNPRGYPDEYLREGDNGFDPGLVIELSTP